MCGMTNEQTSVWGGEFIRLPLKRNISILAGHKSLQFPYKHKSAKCLRWTALFMNSHSKINFPGAVAFQITSLTIICPTIYPGADQRKHQCSASLAFVRVIHRWPVNSLHKGPGTRKMFPFDDVIMYFCVPTDSFLKRCQTITATAPHNWF